MNLKTTFQFYIQNGCHRWCHYYVTMENDKEIINSKNDIVISLKSWKYFSWRAVLCIP